MFFISSATVLRSRNDNSALRPVSRVECCGRDADVGTLVEPANRPCHSAIADSALQRKVDGVFGMRQVLTSRPLRKAYVLCMVRNTRSACRSTVLTCPVVCV